MRRLKRRKRMFVNQLDLSAAFENQAELVEARHATLEHDPIDEEKRHSFLIARSGGEKQILKRRLAGLLHS